MPRRVYLLPIQPPSRRHHGVLRYSLAPYQLDPPTAPPPAAEMPDTNTKFHQTGSRRPSASPETNQAGCRVPCTLNSPLRRISGSHTRHTKYADNNKRSVPAHDGKPEELVTRAIVAAQRRRRTYVVIYGKHSFHYRHILFVTTSYHFRRHAPKTPPPLIRLPPHRYAGFSFLYEPSCTPAAGATMKANKQQFFPSARQKVCPSRLFHEGTAIPSVRRGRCRRLSPTPKRYRHTPRYSVPARPDHAVARRSSLIFFSFLSAGCSFRCCRRHAVTSRPIRHHTRQHRRRPARPQRNRQWRQRYRTGQRCRLISPSTHIMFFDTADSFASTPRRLSYFT